jgi:uncharacterized delta-60 repeat protein
VRRAHPTEWGDDPRRNQQGIIMTTRRRTPSILRSAAIEALESRTLLAAAGDLDPVFGAEGRVVIDFPGDANDPIEEAHLQSTSKIVVRSGHSLGSSVLARFNVNGQLDNTFGNGGTLTIPFAPQSFAVRGDDKIVVAGVSANAHELVLARYTASGQPDTSFGGGDGHVERPLFGVAPGPQRQIAKVLVRPDNRILVAGSIESTQDTGQYDFALSSYTEAGDVDLFFGLQLNGVTFTDFGNADTLADVVLAPGNKIVAVGSITASDSHHPFNRQDFAIARYTDSGQPDSTFGGGDGMTTVTFDIFPQTHPLADTGDSFDFADAVAVDGNSNIVVVGRSYDPSDNDPFYLGVARLTPAGDLDVNFSPGGQEGTGKLWLSPDAQFVPKDVELLTGGKILIMSSVDGESGHDFSLTRLNSSGSLDSTFGTGGKVTTNFGMSDDAQDMLIQDGKILVVGGSGFPTANPGPNMVRGALARYLAEPTPPPAQTPFNGTPLSLPGTLQFENFDEGGEAVAYHDLETANLGGAYRVDGVDLQTIPTSSGGGVNLGFAKAGEWTEYTISVPAAQAGQYDVALRIASLRGGGKFHLEIDGQRVTATTTVPSTGDWQKYTTLKLGPIDLAAGTHVLRLAMDANDSIGYVANFDSAEFTKSGARTPFKGTPFLPNQTIEAEDFDNGGEGLAYHDTDSANVGGVYRPSERVDLQPSADTGGGYNVGFAKAGEWLAYSLDVPTPMAQSYAIQVRVASLRGGGRFHLEIDGKNVAGFTVPSTGDWQKYTTLTSARIPLSTGAHTLRLVMDTEDSTHYVANFNWMKLVP